MEKLARTKDFCPNAACPDFGKLQSDQAQANLKKIGKTPRGVQRYQCKTCGKTFTETRGLSTTIRFTYQRQLEMPMADGIQTYAFLDCLLPLEPSRCAEEAAETSTVKGGSSGYPP